MEKKNDDIKIGIHSQRTRIMNEEDEIWISSEDLNTENSSDEDRPDSKNAFKKKIKLKHRKRSSSNIKIQSSSVASTSKAADQRLVVPKPEKKLPKSDDSRTSDDDISRPSSSDCLSKKLSLEDWRPMKGALNISSLEEAAAGDTGNICNETANFHNVMLYKLKSLKSCSALKTARKEKPTEKETDEAQEETFKFLKNTPEMREKLDFISKLDDEINDTINRYKAERAERRSIEWEVCKSIRENRISQERGAEIFLDLCNFKGLLEKAKTECEPTCFFAGEDDAEADEEEPLVEEYECNEDAVQKDKCDSLEENPNPFSCKDTNENRMIRGFIKRNIDAAKEGTMASFSLTDEQKSKIAEILKDIEDFSLDDGELSTSAESLANENRFSSVDREEQSGDFSGTNAFVVTERDKIRMGEIDGELEKFTEDEKANEKTSFNKNVVNVVNNDQFWKQYVLDQTLKGIDAKLNNLYQSYIEDEEKLKHSIPTPEESEDTDDI